MKKTRRGIIFLLSALPLLGNAQKIDFNMTGRQEAEVTETGWTPWAVNMSQSETLTLDGLSVTVAATGNSTRLRAQWSKGDLKSGKPNMQLLGDAVVAFIADEDNNTPNQTTVPMSVSLTLSGLSAGTHSLQAYHNGVNGYKNIAPIDVYVDGTLVSDDIIQSENALSIDKAGVSYTQFSVEQGKDVTITFVSDPKADKEYGSTLVYLNGIIIDETSTMLQASNPYPETGDFHAEADGGQVILQWLAAQNATTHDLYFGTSPDKLDKLASLNDTCYTVSGLSNLQTYYWRVDECTADGTVSQGEVWNFRPRHLAFPGAEGYGKYAIGGRGGTVYHVTTLEDNGNDANPVEGSLRYGIKKVSGPRTIVFDVSGIIHLKSRLTCSDKYVTIAGQTAPGNGIMLRTSPFGMATDGITRFIRMGLGHKKLINGVIPSKDKNGYSYGEEAGTTDETILSGNDGMGMAGNTNAIMDHCSISWTIDEAFSSRNAQSVTLQRTLISETLNQAGHPNYSAGKRHGFAATIGGGEMSAKLTCGSYHHNLLAHNEGRNWSISGGLDGSGAYDGHHYVSNNVVYNWGGRATDGGTHEMNFVGNFYKMGASTTQTVPFILQLEGTGTGTQSAYVSGNVRQAKNNGALTEDEYKTTYSYTTSNGQVVDWEPFVSEQFFEPLATVETARAAYKNVLSDVGANQPFFNAHDKRMVNETLSGTTSTKGSRSGKAGLIDSEEDEGCEGFDGLGLIEEHRPDNWDTDGDGMPDWWEEAAGVDNSNADWNNDGYTNLEDYLNWLAYPHYTIEKGEVSIDLTQLFAGYNNKPTFSIVENSGNMAASINGTILTEGAGQSASPLASLLIKATDADNWGELTRQLNFYMAGTTGIKDLKNNTQAVTRYEIYTVDGKKVRSAKNTSALLPGVYVVKALAGGRVVETTKRIVD